MECVFLFLDKIVDVLVTCNLYLSLLFCVTFHFFFFDLFDFGFIRFGRSESAKYNTNYKILNTKGKERTEANNRSK